MKQEPEEPSVQISDEGRSSPDSSTSQVTPRTVVLVILTAVAVLSGLYLLWQVRKVIVWCIIALFAAVALDPAVNWIQRWRTRRITATYWRILGYRSG